MSAENHLLDGIVLPGRLLAVRQPLDGKRRPLQGVRNDQIVEKRCVLFPDLVFLVYQPLLYLSPHLLFVFPHFLLLSLSVFFVLELWIISCFFMKRRFGVLGCFFFFFFWGEEGSRQRLSGVEEMDWVVTCETLELWVLVIPRSERF